MSAIPLYSSSEWQGSNGFYRPDLSYDVVGYQNVDGSEFEAAQQYESTQPDYIIGEYNSQVYYPLGQANVHAQTYTPEHYPPYEEHMYHPDLESTPMGSRWIELRRDELLYHAAHGISAPLNGLSTYQSEVAMRPVYSLAGPSGRSGLSQVEVDDLVQVDNSQIRIIVDTKGRNVKQRQCSTCQKWFEAKPSNWQRHMDTHSRTKRYRCKVCKNEWVTKDQVSVHYIKHHMKVGPGKSPEDKRKEAKNYVERV